MASFTHRNDLRKMFTPPSPVFEVMDLKCYVTPISALPICAPITIELFHKSSRLVPEIALQVLFPEIALQVLFIGGVGSSRIEILDIEQLLTEPAHATAGAFLPFNV